MNPNFNYLSTKVTAVFYLIEPITILTKKNPQVTKLCRIQLIRLNYAIKVATLTLFYLYDNQLNLPLSILSDTWNWVESNVSGIPWPRSIGLLSWGTTKLFKYGYTWLRGVLFDHVYETIFEVRLSHCYFSRFYCVFLNIIHFEINGNINIFNIYLKTKNQNNS